MNVKVNNYQTDYLQKTIILKDDQIKELLEELRQTQELHQNLKKKYMGQEQVLREKLKKFQNIVDELKKENEDLTMKFKRTVKEKNTSDGQLEIVSKQWDSAITEINDNMLKLRYENEMLLKENRLLKE